MAQIPLNNFLLDVNFDKFAIRLHFIFISFILAKFSKNQRSIIMLLTNFYISSFCNIRLCIKNKFMDRIVNNIQLEQNLTCVLRA